MEQLSLKAKIREQKGKSWTRKLRREKKVPGIVYGPDTPPIMIAVDYPELLRVVSKASGENIFLDLHLQTEGGVETKKVMLKELQTDPVKDTFLHADFYAISVDKELTFEIPIILENTPVGVTKGGILQHALRELTITCLPDKLIESIRVDVSQLDIGDAIHVNDLQLPEGIEVEDEPETTVAVVVAPAVSAEEAAEEAAEEEVVEEGEVEAEGSKE